MKTKRVINRSNFPTRLPVMGTLFYFLCLDYWDAPEWAFGVYYTLFGIYWIIAIVALYKEEDVDLFENTTENTPPPVKKSFMDKLNERMEATKEQREAELAARKSKL